MKDPLLGAHGAEDSLPRTGAENIKKRTGKRPEEKLKEQSDAFQQKRRRNPFAESIHKAELYKEKREQADRRKAHRGNGDAHGAVDQDGVGEGVEEESLGALMLEQGHLPDTSAEYFAEITTKVDTSEILEIVQVFSHQQNRSAGMRASASASSLAAQAKQNQSTLRQGVSGDTNDYVVIVIKINSSQLRRFFGNGRYLVQVWRNKRRLFQHVHNCKLIYPSNPMNILAIYLFFLYVVNLMILLNVDSIKSIYLNKTEIAYMLNVPSKHWQ